MIFILIINGIISRLKKTSAFFYFFYNLLSPSQPFFAFYNLESLFMNEPTNIESLVVKYLNDTINEDEYRELTSWIARSKENELMFNQVREILLVSRVNDRDFQFDVHAALERIRKKTQLNKPIPRFRNAKPLKTIRLSYRWAAAIVLFIMVGNILLYRWIHLPVEQSHAYQEITVPLGSRSKLLLPDGSHVALNAGSSLRYRTDFGTKHRNLWLDGEGYFDVNKSSAPFVVHSGSVQIKAVGTSFNVRAYSSEDCIETTLVKGKVMITDTENRQAESREVTLLPNQKLIVPKNKILSQQNTSNNSVVQTNENRSQSGPRKSMTLQEKINPVPDVSWKDNEWVIYREDLASLAVKLERRFDVKIVFEDERLKSFRYNGSLPDLSLEQVLDIMSMVSPVQYSVNGKTVVFSVNQNYRKSKNF